MMELSEQIRELPITKHQRKHVLQIADEVKQLKAELETTRKAFFRQTRYLGEASKKNKELQVYKQEVGEMSDLMFQFAMRRIKAESEESAS